MTGILGLWNTPERFFCCNGGSKNAQQQARLVLRVDCAPISRLTQSHVVTFGFRDGGILLWRIPLFLFQEQRFIRDDLSTRSTRASRGRKFQI